MNLELARLSAERLGMVEHGEKESENLLDSESADAETRLAVPILLQNGQESAVDKLLQKENVLTMGSITGRKEPAIEDMTV